MEKIEKNLYVKLILLSLWSSFFLSINLNPLEFFEYNFINQIRLVLPIFLTIALTIFKYKEIKIFNFQNIYSFYFILFFFFIFFLLLQHLKIIMKIFIGLYICYYLFLPYINLQIIKKKNFF